MSAYQSNKRTIVVVGAGIIGLSCALVLVKNGYNVTVVAEYLPGDINSKYTSPWAGAHFRPFPSNGPSESREANYTRETQKFFRYLAINYPESSIRFINGVEYLEEPSELYQSISTGYKEQMRNFKVLKNVKNLVDSETISIGDGLYVPKNVKLATFYETWVLNAPLYLEFLYRRLNMFYNVKFQRFPHLKSLNQVFTKFPNVDGIVNATGFGLQFNKSGYDPACFAIRGQTLLVRGPVENKNNPYSKYTITCQNKDGTWTFVIPRPLDGGYIIGGTKQIGEKKDTPIKNDTESLISKGKKLFPELLIDKGGKEKEFDIVKINVGFRPARKGGSRVEVENVFLDRSKKKSKFIIHAYGVGGMGYEVSYGIGLQVGLLANEQMALKSSKL